MLFEDRFIYQPSKYPHGQWNLSQYVFEPEAIYPQIQDCYFQTVDNVALHGWYAIPTRLGKPLKSDSVLLWLHGNAGNVSHRFELISYLMNLPTHVLMLDYRGYGKSSGKPSELGLYLDALAAWQFLLREKDIAPEQIIIVGESLGAAVAIELVSRISAAGLILQAGFTSIAQMAAQQMPWLPTALLHNKLDSLRKIPYLALPKLIIHSKDDEIVPYAHAEELYAAAQPPKELYTVESAPHNELYRVEGELYIKRIRNFVRSCLRRNPAYAQ